MFDCEVTMGRAGGGVKGEGGVLELDEDGCERIYTDIDYGPFNNDGMGTDQICLTWTCHIGIIFERRAVGIKLTTRMAISTTILSLSLQSQSHLHIHSFLSTSLHFTLAEQGSASVTFSATVRSSIKSHQCEALTSRHDGSLTIGTAAFGMLEGA